MRQIDVSLKRSRVKQGCQRRDINAGGIRLCLGGLHNSVFFEEQEKWAYDEQLFRAAESL